MKKEFSVIAQVADLDTIEDSKALIAGDVVFATMADESAGHDKFIRQDDRATSSNLLDQYKRNAKKLRVSVDPALIGVKGRRFAFAIDAYLAWGRRQKSKDPVVLFGGAHTANGVNVDVMVFIDGRLVAYSERVLPHLEAFTFRNSLTSLIEGLKDEYRDAAFYQAEPLAEWKIPEVNWVGREALKGLRYKRVIPQATNSVSYALPAGVALAGVAIYIGVITVGWQRLQAAGADYEIAIDNPEIRKQGGINTEYLDLMNTRRLYLEEPRKQEVLAKKAAEIAAGVAKITGLRIMEMHLPAPTANTGAQIGLNAHTAAAQTMPGSEGNQLAVSGREPDVLLVLSAPKTSATGLDQAESMMAGVAEATGLSLRLAMGGTREADGKRVFNVEGFIHE
ncbi:hypothetical protein [Hydrogenophaga sp. 2FB]|uniref:hypothetical protein n=1 Tax=Hydrogenophaga sp. 2FB TaxID=2502187 RepID=UPI0010FA6136|nr:hypothetical protein [Hydrogenophaga sp. 2FB]